MKYFLTIALMIASTVFAQQQNTTPDENTIKVAVLDTGFDFKSSWNGINVVDKNGVKLVKPKICKKDHKDFTGTSVNDSHGHGTHIVGTIAKISGDSNYCIVILKTYHLAPSIVGVNAVIEAFKYAVKVKADIINYSGGGTAYSAEEYEAVKNALNQGIVVVTAAGNDGHRVDYNILKINKLTTDGSYHPVYIHSRTQEVTTQKQNGYYPGSYDPRIISVGNKIDEKHNAPTTNYGAIIKVYEIGTDVLSLLPGNEYGHMSGTSQSAAIRTGKIIKKWKK